MAEKDTNGREPATGRAEDTERAEVAVPAEDGERTGHEPDDVSAILDDMDEALEEDPENVIRSFRQEGGQ
jgi:ubiquitin-like protein Pup